MKCIKFNKRSIFNFFDYKKCDGCINDVNDSFFYIGTKRIYIYYLKNCFMSEDDFYYNIKFILILLDVYKNFESLFILWFDYYHEMENYYEVIEKILDKYDYIVIFIYNNFY